MTLKSRRLYPKPARKFLQIIERHEANEILSVNRMDRKNVIFVKEDGIAEVEAMEARFNHAIIDNALEEAVFSRNDLNPEVLSPASRWSCFRR